ncbi:hypothetical protein F4604DRAFT_1675085 [Suillus subluteus]|nr:hypothetical protein F4604DRAFT_1675085 [Suillus subluteus]
MPPSAVAVYNCSYIQKNGSKVALINSPTDSVMPVVLTHRSSTNFAPLSTTMKGLTEREYQVETCNSTWTSACKEKCPTLWHHMDNGLLVTWQNENPDPNLGAGTDCTVNLHIADSRSHNAGLPCIIGLLFGAAMMQPRTVPVYLDKGRSAIVSIDDLNPQPFIRERGMEPSNIIECRITRQMVGTNDWPFYKNGTHYPPLTPPRSNMLVIMQNPMKKNQPRNILPREWNKVADYIIETDEHNELFKGVLHKRQIT